MTGEGIAAALAAKADALVRRDAAGLTALIHPDFVYVNARGVCFDRAGYVETFCRFGAMAFREQRIEDLAVRLFDGFAVATMTVRDRFAAGGEEVAASYRAMAVFAEADGRLLWAAGQTMPLAAP